MQKYAPPTASAEQFAEMTKAFTLTSDTLTGLGYSDVSAETVAQAVASAAQDNDRTAVELYAAALRSLGVVG